MYVLMVLLTILPTRAGDLPTSSASQAGPFQTYGSCLAAGEQAAMSLQSQVTTNTRISWECDPV